MHSGKVYEISITNFFLLFFQLYITLTECGEEKRADEGEIQTPNYNTQYPNNVDCAWTITKAAEEKDLWFRFTEFDLEDSLNCTADYVVIRDGKDNNASLIGNYF